MQNARLGMQNPVEARYGKRLRIQHVSIIIIVVIIGQRWAHVAFFGSAARHQHVYGMTTEHENMSHD